MKQKLIDGFWTKTDHTTPHHTTPHHTMPPEAVSLLDKRQRPSKQAPKAMLHGMSWDMPSGVLTTSPR